MDDDGFLIIVGLVSGVLLSLCFCLFVFHGDSYDGVNTAYLGGILCDEHDLEYDYRTWKTDENGGRMNVPVIHCKDKNIGTKQAVALVDGVVVKDVI